MKRNRYIRVFIILRMSVQETTSKHLGRPPDTKRKDELLQQVANELQFSGFIFNSLRSLARKIDVSPNALIYHFGSKAKLYSDALAFLRKNEIDRMLSSFSFEGSIDFEHAIETIWSEFSMKEARAATLAFYEVWISSVRDPHGYSDFMDHVVADWLSFGMAIGGSLGLEEKELEGLVTLVLGTIRGMMLDLLTSGEEARPRFDAAIEHLKVLVRNLTVRRDDV